MHAVLGHSQAVPVRGMPSDSTCMGALRDAVAVLAMISICIKLSIFINISEKCVKQ